jgi:hypothetical protein
MQTSTMRVDRDDGGKVPSLIRRLPSFTSARRHQTADLVAATAPTDRLDELLPHIWFATHPQGSCPFYEIGRDGNCGIW